MGRIRGVATLNDKESVKKYIINFLMKGCGDTSTDIRYGVVSYANGITSPLVTECINELELDGIIKYELTKCKNNIQYYKKYSVINKTECNTSDLKPIRIRK